MSRLSLEVTTDTWHGVKTATGNEVIKALFKFESVKHTKRVWVEAIYDERQNQYALWFVDNDKETFKIITLDANTMKRV